MKEVEYIIFENGKLIKEIVSTINWDLFPLIMGISFLVLFIINIASILIHKDN